MFLNIDTRYQGWKRPFSALGEAHISNEYCRPVKWHSGLATWRPITFVPYQATIASAELTVPGCEDDYSEARLVPPFSPEESVENCKLKLEEGKQCPGCRMGRWGFENEHYIVKQTLTMLLSLLHADARKNAC
jgi:hypothetical protein